MLILDKANNQNVNLFMDLAATLFRDLLVALYFLKILLHVKKGRVGGGNG